jgi:integrase/recombinase XerC
MNGSPDLPRLLRAFFYEWATQQRNLSPHTIRSYRNACRLFLRFAAEHYHRPATKLRLEDLTDKIVLDFLDHGERVRRGSVGTRNCRLADLRAFFAFFAFLAFLAFLAAREPSTVAQCGAVLHVPTKRAARPSLCYLDANEVEAILAQPDRRTLEGQRDHALLSLLYNTGARKLLSAASDNRSELRTSMRAACGCTIHAGTLCVVFVFKSANQSA